jgi:hypothetical protein
MSEHELEVRLRRAALALDEGAPAFDVARLRSEHGGRRRDRAVVAACIAALVLASAAPAAVSALRGLFEVDVVSELGPLEHGVAPPFAGRSIPPDTVADWAPFGVWTIAALGAPSDARVRDDIAGGMVTLVYGEGPILLTQWRTADVDARVAVVPVDGAAVDVDVRGLAGLWLEGAARGTFALTGADGMEHRESFEVAEGALLWERDGLAFLLSRAPSSAEAVRLAATLRRYR